MTIGPDGQPVVRVPGVPIPGAPVLAQTPAPPEPAPAAATPFKAANDDEADGEQKPEGAAEGDFDDDDMENSLSLAAIEAELKPEGAGDLPRLSGSVVSRGLPRGSQVRGCRSCRKIARWRPDRFAARGDRLLEQMMLNVLRQPAPHPHDRLAQRADELLGQSR